MTDRYFAWVRTPGMRRPYAPIIIHGDLFGPKQKLFGKQKLSPAEYSDSLTDLAERYPAPISED
jgi:hypothetical protein